MAETYFGKELRRLQRNNCPVTHLYWAFLSRHEKLLSKNPRLAMPMRSLSKRGVDLQKKDRAAFKILQELLSKGEAVEPDDLP